MAKTSNRTKGGRKRVFSNLETRVRQYDEMPATRKQGTKRPGSRKK